MSTSAATSFLGDTLPETGDPLTFEGQMLLKDVGGHFDTSDEAWYVGMVAYWTLMIQDLYVPEGYRFSISPPNPDIAALFRERVPAQIAAIELFDRRH